MSLVPLNLFVTHDGRSARQHVTCRYKCGDACFKPVRNTSDNEYFGDIAKAVSRRSMLQEELGYIERMKPEDAKTAVTAVCRSPVACFVAATKSSLL